ncbi:MAG: SGNH/GDSL hydrolase family protein [Nitrospirae bacterium]|nr:SGNH/GDSL hydrolase family protein [Nitrospirota bacterium]
MKKVLLLFFSIFFVFLSGELVLRYKIKDWPFKAALYTPDYLTKRDKPLRWRFSPTNGRNSLGLRNREIGPKKKGVYRILFLGDSLIWSGETTSGKYFTEVLEDRLNAKYSTRTRSYEVINAGVPGYTTYQELEFLKIYGLDMKPDIVVLGFVFNDLYYKYLHRPTSSKLFGTDLSTRLHYFNTDSFPGIIFARSQFAHEIARRSIILWKMISKQPIYPFERRRDFYLAWKDYGWTHTQKLIGTMQKLLKDKGIPFRILVYPVTDQVNDQYRRINKQYVLYPQRMIRKICDAYGIPELDLTNALYKNGGTTLFRDYLHLNEKGNDVVTNKVERFLVKEMKIVKPGVKTRKLTSH